MVSIFTTAKNFNQDDTDYYPVVFYVELNLFQHQLGIYYLGGSERRL